MGQTAAIPGWAVLLQKCCDQHVELAGLLVLKDKRVSIMQWCITWLRRGEWIWQRFLKVDAILADSQAQMLGPVQFARGIKGVECIIMMKNRTGADRAFPFLINRQRQGVLFPVDQIA